MMDKHSKYCDGCRYYFKPKSNVLCNNSSGKSCKRLTLAMIDDKEDLFELDDPMEDDLK